MQSSKLPTKHVLRYLRKKSTAFLWSVGVHRSNLQQIYYIQRDHNIALLLCLCNLMTLVLKLRH